MKLSAFVFGLFGWKVTGGIPEDLKKYVIIAAPHTSSIDFAVGVFARSIIGRDIKFLGKKSLFKPPLGWILQAMGGYPVDRSGNANMVAQVVEIFDSKEEFAIALSPEGTRQRVDQFKSGYYHIAKGAGVPIIMTSFDYAARVVHFNPAPFYPTNSQESDMQKVWNYYRGIRGKVPAYGVH